MVPRVIRMLIKAFRVNLKKFLQPPPRKKKTPYSENWIPFQDLGIFCRKAPECSRATSTIAAYFVVREYFQVPNHALEQPKPNILPWLKVLNSSTKFGKFKNFGREVRNFDGARRIFYEVRWHIFGIFKKIWLIKIC